MYGLLSYTYIFFFSDVLNFCKVETHNLRNRLSRMVMKKITQKAKRRLLLTNIKRFFSRKNKTNDMEG